MSGLPYDGTPPPDEARTIEPNALDRPLGEYTEPSALDRPLDDYRPPREEVPEHVQSLMGRMGKGRVYLLEESPAMVMMDDGERLRRDPRLAQLAEQLDTQDPTEWLGKSCLSDANYMGEMSLTRGEAVSAGASSPILHQVLWVQSELIKHLSTSKVFSWATGLGASVMGIEWLNDTTLQLLFSSSANALLGLSLLSKAGFDPGEGDDPLLERSAHSFPLSLLPSESKEGVELLAPSSDPADAEVKRRGRGGFKGGMTSDQPDLLDTSSAQDRDAEEAAREWNLAQGIDPNARIAIRYATESDKTARQQAKQSEWYKRHGRTAGKERSGQTRQFGDSREDSRLSFRDREEGGAGGREFGKRISRERKGPYERRSGASSGRRDQSDLDRELDGMVQRRLAGDEGIVGGGGDVDVTMDTDMDIGDGAGRDRDRDRRRDGRGRGGRGGGQRRERRGVEDLDKELDDLFAARTADR